MMRRCSKVPRCIKASAASFDRLLRSADHYLGSRRAHEDLPPSQSAFNTSNVACHTAILSNLKTAEPRAIVDMRGRPSTRWLLLVRPIHEMFATPV